MWTGKAGLLLARGEEKQLSPQHPGRIVLILFRSLLRDQLDRLNLAVARDDQLREAGRARTLIVTVETDLPAPLHVG